MSNKKLLAIDCSGVQLSIALLEGEKPLAELTGEFIDRPSGRILPALQFLLDSTGWELESLDGIAVGIGPGSFTGLRVGIATAQGLCFAANLPLIGIPSTDALAFNGAIIPQKIIASVIDARKGEVYLRIFRIAPDGLPIPLTPNLLLSPQDLLDKLEELEDNEVSCLGSGALLYRDLLTSSKKKKITVPPVKSSHIVSSSAIGILAQRKLQRGEGDFNPASIQPIYIRPSEAELNIGPPEGGAPLKGRLTPDGRIMPEK